MVTPLVILLFFGVMFITLVVFVFWIVIAVIRGIIRMLASITVGSPPKPQAMLMLTRCVNDRCRTSNASHARFCRRCGAVMSDQRRYATPRMAS